MASQWDLCGEAWGFTAARAEGSKAYATCQAAMFRKLATQFQEEWHLQDIDQLDEDNTPEILVEDGDDDPEVYFRGCIVCMMCCMYVHAKKPLAAMLQPC